MISYLIGSIIESGVDKNPILVVSPDNIDIINDNIKKYDCLFAEQDKQLGT
jgi:hypothetical protein